MITIEGTCWRAVRTDKVRADVPDWPGIKIWRKVRLIDEWLLQTADGRCELSRLWVFVSHLVPETKPDYTFVVGSQREPGLRGRLSVFGLPPTLGVELHLVGALAVSSIAHARIIARNLARSVADGHLHPQPSGEASQAGWYAAAGILPGVLWQRPQLATTAPQPPGGG